MSYLRARGYDVSDWHVTQDLEKQVPTDWIFVDRSRLKVFGLQYKALYSNGSDHWRLDRNQHGTLQGGFPWVYYAASEIRRPREQTNALGLLRIYAPDIPYRTRLIRRGRRVRYLRWPTFFRAFVACLVGYRVASRSRFESILREITGTGPIREARQMTDHFFVDIERKRALRVRAQRRA